MMTVESSVFARSPITLEIELFNFTTDSWEVVHSGVASRFVDSAVVIEPSGDLSRFVNVGDSLIRSRVRYDSANRRQRFSANIDHVEWEIQ